jgi:hypothetical protein
VGIVGMNVGSFAQKIVKAYELKTEIMRCINCREKFEQKVSEKHCSNCKTAEREYQSEKMAKTEKPKQSHC